MAMNCMGDLSVSKLPDLLFDLKMPGTPMRIALEMERTRKSQGRYQTMRNAYGRANNLDGVLFGVAEERIEECIAREIYQGGLEFTGREVGFFFIEDFLQCGLQATLKISNKEKTLEEYFHELASQNN